MRRIVRILRLLRNQRRVKLLIPIDVTWVDVLSRLAIRSLNATNTISPQTAIVIYFNTYR